MLACCRTEMESRVRVKVQRTRRAQEGRWTTTSARESGSEGVSDLIIQLKKPLNPVRVSKSHQELHRELRMTHKTWGLHKVAHTRMLNIHTNTRTHTHTHRHQLP